MKNFLILWIAVLFVALAPPSFAKWVASQNPTFIGGYTVENTKTGQRLSTKYKNEKQAKKAAKVLNKADKSVMAGPDGQGDHREGGELPF